MKLLLEVRADGRPVAALVAPANRAENYLLEELFDESVSEQQPEYLLADKAYDDDPLRQRPA